ncbi:alpha/beta fold hydrolase [Streptomyces sp. TP-A0356]|uniref:alpha/beta fold hydrolase n=1 Tax=Streptomyces sp. TP-A0356 TaxID=1359208 RepID=UPI0006E123BA|nr:alpha/beta fold hydrolase [Streptomyces sp. TP-A0356]
MERPITTRDGLRLWTETFGSRRDPAVLPGIGGTAPGIVWPDELCRLLAVDGYFVARYDHRDTGRSGKSDGEYDLSAPASDAAEVIAGLGLGRAHVVGPSFGGMVAQLLALDRPELVWSLVLLSSSPDANGDVWLPRAPVCPVRVRRCWSGPPGSPLRRRSVPTVGRLCLHFGHRTPTKRPTVGRIRTLPTDRRTSPWCGQEVKGTRVQLRTCGLPGSTVTLR